MSISLIASSILQVILFSTLPFLWWLIGHRKNVSFFNWLGIKTPKIEHKKKYMALFFSTILILFLSSFLAPLFVDHSDMATSQFLGQGISALLPAVIYAFVQTGLAEEIFFQGLSG